MAKDNMSDTNETTSSAEEKPMHLSDISRRGLFTSMGMLGAGASLSAVLAACSNSSTPASSSSGIGTSPSSRRLKAAFTNNNLGATWCAQGKVVAETWGKWLGVDVTWYDGGGTVDQQRKALDTIATKKWDFVAIQAVGVDTLTSPVQQLISNGVPVIQMDTEIDSSHQTKITTFLEPDNVYMGEVSATAMFEKIGGKGDVVMTWGALGHTGAQGRAKGFDQALAKYPNINVVARDSADWDVNKVQQLWETYLTKYPNLVGGFLHNDDMALAAAKVVQNAGRTVAISGIDAMPPAIQAVISGTLTATVRNPSGRIHWGAIMVGILAANGVKDIPTYILADGPVVTSTNGPGLVFMENQSLL